MKLDKIINVMYYKQKKKGEKEMDSLREILIMHSLKKEEEIRKVQEYLKGLFSDYQEELSVSFGEIRVLGESNAIIPYKVSEKGIYFPAEFCPSCGLFVSPGLLLENPPKEKFVSYLLKWVDHDCKQKKVFHMHNIFSKDYSQRNIVELLVLINKALSRIASAVDSFR